MRALGNSIKDLKHYHGSHANMQLKGQKFANIDSLHALLAGGKADGKTGGKADEKVATTLCTKTNRLDRSPATISYTKGLH